MERDARGKAADAVERRARQRDAAARAQQALTPEAIEAERKRQVENAALIHGGDTVPVVVAFGENDMVTVERIPVSEFSAPTHNAVDSHLSDRLAEAVQPVLDAPEETREEEYEGPAPIGVGRAVIQWILVPSDDDEGDNVGGYQLGLQVQVDEQPPGGVVLDVTLEMLDRWRAGVGLQKNRVEHKRFAAGIIERAVELAALETGNNLIFTLEQLMQAQEDGGPEKWNGGYAPTETAVGEDDGPFKDAPSEADEVPE